MPKIALLTFAVILLPFCFLTPAPVFAQTTSESNPASSPFIAVQKTPERQINLTVTPTFINLVTDPGVPVSSQVKVQNNTKAREYLKISLAKFSANETGDRPKLEVATPEDKFINWVLFSEAQFVLYPNEQKTIKFTITPSKDAALDYNFAALIERVKEGTDLQKEGISNSTPAFLIILEVRSPQERKELTLLDFKPSSLWYEYLPTTFNIKFKNTGNVHIIASGEIFIDSAIRKEVGVVPLNPERGNILPQTTRSYRSSWEDGFISRVPKLYGGTAVIDSQGNLIYETKIDWSKNSKFRFGKYTAHLLAVYDNGQQDIPLEATVSFWVIPWKIIVAFLLAVLLLLILLKSLAKNGLS